MAKSIVTYCDVCLSDDDTYTEGHTIDDIRLGRQLKTRTVDLCDVHEKEYVTPFVELIQRLGTIDSTAAPVPVRPPAHPNAAPSEHPRRGRPRSLPDDEVCQVCGNQLNPKSAEKHYRDQHKGQSRARLLLANGVVSSISECEQCDSAFVSPQGLSLHIARTH